MEEKELIKKLTEKGCTISRRPRDYNFFCGWSKEYCGEIARFVIEGCDYCSFHAEELAKMTDELSLEMHE